MHMLWLYSSSVKCVAHNCTTSLKVWYSNLSLFRLFNNNNNNDNNNNNNNNTDKDL